MNVFLTTIIGFSALLASSPVISGAMTPDSCDRLAQWVYTQAQVRDTKEVSRKEHEAAARSANSEQGADVLALLMRELAKVYDEGKSPIMAAMDSRFECYSRRGEIGVEVRK